MAFTAATRNDLVSSSAGSTCCGAGARMGSHLDGGDDHLCGGGSGSASRSCLKATSSRKLKAIRSATSAVGRVWPGVGGIGSRRDSGRRAVGEQLRQPLALKVEVDLQDRRLLDRADLGQSIRPVAHLAHDAGADTALKKEIVLAIGQLLVGQHRADAHRRLDGRLLVIILLPTRLEQSDSHAMVAGQRVRRHHLVSLLEDVQRQHRAGKQHHVGQGNNGTISGFFRTSSRPVMADSRADRGGCLTGRRRRGFRIGDEAP